MRKQAATARKPLGALHLEATELVRLAADPRGRETLSVAAGTSAVVVELEHGTELPDLGQVSELACVVVGITRDGCPEAGVDVLLAEDPTVPGAVAPGEGLARGLERLLGAVATRPIASATLAMLLRGGAGRSIREGLEAESLAYSTLQSGPECRTAVASLGRVEARHAGPTVRVRRSGDGLEIVLSRPEVHNAFNLAMRDELVEALSLAAVDPAIRSIILRGEGPSFCSGGDLAEFGTLEDPARAHLIRMTRSTGRLMALLRDRLHARLHGACIGAGIELAAFAGRVTAAPDAFFMLPEVGFGLVPGAGGTVSIPARIGRQRTAWLALSGEKLDAATALAWGLVDELDP